MILATIHLSITNDQLNMLMALRRAEIKKRHTVDYLVPVLAGMVNAGLVVVDVESDTVRLTACGRLVLDSLGKESVCAS